MVDNLPNDRIAVISIADAINYSMQSFDAETLKRLSGVSAAAASADALLQDTLTAAGIKADEILNPENKYTFIALDQHRKNGSSPVIMLARENADGSYNVEKVLRTSELSDAVGNGNGKGESLASAVERLTYTVPKEKPLVIPSPIIPPNPQKDLSIPEEMGPKELNLEPRQLALLKAQIAATVPVAKPIPLTGYDGKQNTPDGRTEAQRTAEAAVK